MTDCGGLQTMHRIASSFLSTFLLLGRLCSVEASSSSASWTIGSTSTSNVYFIKRLPTTHQWSLVDIALVLQRLEAIQRPMLDLLMFVWVWPILLPEPCLIGNLLELLVAMVSMALQLIQATTVTLLALLEVLLVSVGRR